MKKPKNFIELIFGAIAGTIDVISTVMQGSTFNSVRKIVKRQKSR